MDISFHSEGIRFELKAKSKHKKWIRKWLESHKFQAGEISYVFTSNEQLRLMNKKFLNHNYFTDVITFDYNEENLISGDIFVSVEQVRINSREFKSSFENELSRVVIHGVLHLLGYDDASHNEIKVMRKEEEKALALF